ncbi:MAG: hypothetical protein JJU21_01205 [Salinarimonas sp.]|nr:hypothetical protein [Salinarimonas sp.]
MTERIDAASGLALVIAWFALLVTTLSGEATQALAAGAPSPLMLIGMAAALFYLVAQATRYSRFVWSHLTFGAVVTIIAVFVLASPLVAVAEAFWRSVFIMVLFSALGVLRVAAQTSPMVHETGAMLVRQPPGRRYFALLGGTTLFAAILNFGVVALFGGMIRDAIKAAPGDAAVAKARERRMMLAMLRGFSLTMFWCPLTVAFAIATTGVSGAQWPLMVLIGTVLAVMTAIAGWVLDSGASRRAAGTGDAVPFSFAALLPLVVLLVLLSSAAALVERFTPGQLIHGVILFVPLIGLVWVVRDTGTAGLALLRSYIVEQAPQQRQEISVLGNAAYAGTLIGMLLPQVFIDALIGPQGLPPVFVPALFMLLVVLFGLIGANPLITVAVLASVMADPSRYGVDPTLVASALAIGWGMAIASSPATAATMYIGRLTGYGSFTVGTRWNAGYAAVAVLLIGTMLTLLGLWRGV